MLFGLGVLLILNGDVWAQISQETAPGKLFPGGINNCSYFYVFGPRGRRSAGREDSVMVAFYRFPSGTFGPVSIHVFDPGVEGARDRRSWGRKTTTEFTVYGGRGTHSDPISKTARPTSEQLGTPLYSRSFKTGHANQWIEFGPYNMSQGESDDGWVYFKLVAVGLNGSRSNFFGTAVTPMARVEAFSYSTTIHLDRKDRATLNFELEAPPNVDTIIEHNYDMDSTGTPSLVTEVGPFVLRKSATGKWHESFVTIDPMARTRRLAYTIRRGSQTSANCGFYFTDGEGNPLKVFFNPAPVLKPPVKLAPANTCEIDLPLVHLEKRVPQKVALGEEYLIELDVSAKTELADVRITDAIPEGAQYVDSNPRATVNGRMPSWTFAAMQSGEVKNIKIRARAQREGELIGCATLAAIPRGCLSTFVGKAEIAITKTGPARARLGDVIEYEITVSNPGTAIASDVVVKDNVPDGLSHESGSRVVTHEIGELDPEQSRVITIELKVDKRGRFCNTAVVETTNAGHNNAEACTVIVQPLLEITKTATPEAYIGKKARYNITVRNPGDVDLTDVVITDTAPPETSIFSAKGATTTVDEAVWRVPVLKAGMQQNLELLLTSDTLGTRCNHVEVTSSEDLSDTAEACTLWKGYPALLLEVIDTEDPLLIGESTQYIIRITNQGSGDDTNVTIVAGYPREITPTAAGGATAGRVAGKVVWFSPYARLTPKEMIEFTIDAKAAVKGDSRLLVKMNSDLLKTPVTEEESTQVH